MTPNRIKFMEGMAQLREAFERQFPERPKREPASRIIAVMNIIKLKKRVKVLKELLKCVDSWGPDIEDKLDLPDGPRAEQLLDEQWRILGKAGVVRP